MEQFNSKEDVVEYLNALGQDKSIPFNEEQKNKCLAIAAQLGADKEIANKIVEVIKGRFEDADRGNFIADIASPLLSANKNNKKLAQDFAEISELMFQNQFENKKYGDNFITSDMLSIYQKIVENNPADSEVAVNILNRLGKGRVSTETKEEAKNRLFLSMIANEYNDDKFAEAAMKHIGQLIQQEVAHRKSYDANYPKSEIPYISKEYMRGHFSEKMYQSECVSEHDPRYFVVALAEHSLNQPKVVEKCIALCEQFSIDYASIIYGKLALAGYEEKIFKDRYADKLNKAEITVHDGQYAALQGVLDKLNSSVLQIATSQAGSKIANEENAAKKWHRQPRLSSQDYENKEKLSQLADKLLEKEAVAKAKSQKHAPSFIYIEEYAGGNYGDWAERVYVKDEKGKYIPTDIVDDLYFGGEGSTAREQMEGSTLLAVEHGIYHRNNSSEEFTILENNPDFTYRVLDNNTYWRDSHSSTIYHRGANQDSILVSKNPVTGEFEDIPFDVNRSHGDFLEGSTQEGNDTMTVIYKRDAKDGKFYADAEFPAGECIASIVDENGEFMASFLTQEGTYKYVGNQAGSSVYKKGKGDESFQEIEHMPSNYTNKTHTQQPFVNLRLMLENNKRVH